MFHTWHAGADCINPAAYTAIRANGDKAWFGWPTDPKMEELRDSWFQAPDLAAQRSIGAEIQGHAFTTVPFLPLGEYLQPTVYSTSLKGVLKGMPLFWNVERA